MLKSKLKAIEVLIFLMIITLITGIIAMTGIAFADSNSSDFKNGYGTAESPYEITSVKEFNNVRYHRGSYFVQTTNLDFSEYGDFAPIGSVTFPFTGHYDGGKYNISNIHIKQNSNNVGIFAFIDKQGTVENLKVTGGEIEGEYNVGSIAGTNRGTVIGCISSAKIYGKGAVGGIVGLNAAGGQVLECGNLNTVKTVMSGNGGMYAGGVVGVNNSTIQNCYNHGAINSELGEITVTYSGGIVGLNDGENYKAEIDHCYNVGVISGSARGQIAGDNINGKISNCKWREGELDKAVSFDSGEISDAVALSDDGFKTESSFKGWDFKNTWMYIKSKGSYPLLNREYVKVESVSFEKSTIEVQPGKSVEIKAVIKPIHATVNTASLKFNSNIEGISLVNNVLSVHKDVEVGTEFSITAEAEGEKASVWVKVVKIPVESVTLINVEGKTEISQLQSLRFEAKVEPANASYSGVEYKVSSSFAKINEDGVLTLKDNAPVNTEIIVTVNSTDNKLKSDSMTVKIVKEPVKSVKITSNSSFKITETLKLSAEVLPNQATYKDLTYNVLSDNCGAEIVNNVLTAKSLGEITVVATADGVSSAPFTVKVLKEPVTNIVLDIPQTVTCGEIIGLKATVKPDIATYKDITYSIVGENSAKAIIKEGVLYTETAGKVTVSATADGVVCDKEIIVNKIPVEHIELGFTNSFKHTQNLELKVSVSPENATYKEAEYEIINDSADSEIVNGVLHSKKPGTVEVRVTVDGISLEKTISVLKEEVQSVSLNAEYAESDYGETYKFTASVYPTNATNQNVTYILKSGDANLSDDGKLLIDPTLPEGSVIEVYAVVDGVESSVYKIKSGRIDVQSVELAANSGTMEIGEPVTLITTTVPLAVSNPGVTYIVEGNAEIIDGKLYALDEESVGTVIKVKAVVDKVESNTLILNVVETPVENLTFTCATSFKVTENLKLTASVHPQNATDKTVSYTIISGKEIGAEIIDGYLYAQEVGVVKVRATAGIVSRDLVICVQKEPVTRVVLTSSLSVKVNNELKLTATAYPFNATYKDIMFKLVENDIGAEILDGNIFFSSQVGTVTLQVIADGIPESYEIEVKKEPVTGIVFSSKTAFKHTDSLNLVTRVLPTNATYNEVSYTILKDYAGYEEIGARIENGKLYANDPGFIKLRVVTDNGEYSETIEIEVTKEPVTQITMADYDELKFDYDYRVCQIDLATKVYPDNATFNSTNEEVKYNYVTKNCDVIEVDGSIFTVRLEDLLMNGIYAAEEQASITVKAVADGVEFSKNYIIYKEDLESKDEIKFNSKSTAFKTSGDLEFEISLPEKITYKDIDVKILSDSKMGAKLLNDGDSYSITADYPGTVTIQVTSLCGGISNDFEIKVAEEEVKKTVLGLEIKKTGNFKIDNQTYKQGERPLEAIGYYANNNLDQYKIYDGIEVQQGSKLVWRGFGYAENKNLRVTYGDSADFELRFYKDNETKTGKEELKDIDDYLSVIGETITIDEKAPVTAVIYVCVASKYSDAESECTKLIIQSAYIDEVKKAHITNEGVVTGLEHIPTDNIKKVSIQVKHSTTGIVLEKEINTQFPTTILQFYNEYMSGSFEIDYRVYFGQTLKDGTYHTYDYKLENVKTFNGLSGNYSARTYTSDFNSIVWLDNYSNSANSYSFGYEVKAVYIYNSNCSIRKTSLEIFTDTNNERDIYLHNFSFNSPEGKDAISIDGSGIINLITKGNVTITAADGTNKKNSDGKSVDINGKNVISAPKATLRIYNESSLKLIAGNGLAGEKGKTYNRSAGSTGSGRANSGTIGCFGGNGGIGINAISLVLSENHNELFVQGGHGGDGGDGGDGEGSDKYNHPRAGDGGNGGNGGVGGKAIQTESFDLCLNSHMVALSGGDGGAGGNGGSGGHAKCIHQTDDGGHAGDAGNGGTGAVAVSAKQLNVILNGSQCLKINSGNGGVGGNGGNGGDATFCGAYTPTVGAGGNGGNGGDSGNGIMVENCANCKTSLSAFIIIGIKGNGGKAGKDGSGKCAHGPSKSQVAGIAGKMGEVVTQYM